MYRPLPARYLLWGFHASVASTYIYFPTFHHAQDACCFLGYRSFSKAHGLYDDIRLVTKSSISVGPLDTLSRSSIPIGLATVPSLSHQRNSSPTTSIWLTPLNDSLPSSFCYSRISWIRTMEISISTPSPSPLAPTGAYCSPLVYHLHSLYSPPSIPCMYWNVSGRSPLQIARGRFICSIIYIHLSPDDIAGSHDRNALVRPSPAKITPPDQVAKRTATPQASDSHWKPNAENDVVWLQHELAEILGWPCSWRLQSLSRPASPMPPHPDVDALS